MKSSSSRQRWLGARGWVAIFGCVFGIGLVVLGFELVSRSPNNEGPAVANLSTEAHNKKPPRAWNIALGHVVIVAPELGLGATALKENNVDQEKIVARITGQLQSLREIYRQESEKNPALMGGMMLQLTIAPSGEVTHVKEIASRIADSDFKKLVIAEASRWSFQEVVSESLTINCPLLFVREGMDITTVVQWEKSLGQFAGKNTETQKYRPPIQQSKTAAAPMAVSVPLKPDWAKSENAAPIPRAKPVIAAYQIRHATSLRREPNFASSTVAKLPEGMKINMIGERGDWLEVRSDDASLLGFVRKEFVSPFDMARR